MSVKTPLPDEDPKRKKKVFKCWPDIEGVEYGPRPKQKLLFIEHLPEVETLVTNKDTGEVTNLQRPHKHPIDVVLYVGGARAGKTAASTARVISYLLENPGATAIVGATNFPLLSRTMIKEWGDRFKVSVPWDYLNFKNGILVKKPTTTDKRAVFANGSQAYFIHLSDEQVLRGIDADIIAFEEASLLPDEASFEELGRRLSGRKGPLRQLILTTNPTGKGNWIDEKFKLHQFRSDFKGEPEPICKPCSCHKCSRCLKIIGKHSEFEYLDSVCVNCGHEKPNDCPGNQVWMRVIQTQSADNDVVPEDFTESMREFMSETNYNVFVGGSTDDVRQGECYKAFSEENVYKHPEPLSFEKDLIWTLDFNFEPQCSLICQEEETSNGFCVKVLDEIVLWNALPEHAAEEFSVRPDVVKWKEAGRDVLIYGDPSGLYGTGGTQQHNFYQIIYDVLRRHGYNVRILMRKPNPNAVVKESVKIHVGPRVDAVNMMLCHEEDGEKYTRIKINPHCKAIIRSLREVRWLDSGTGMDKNCDRRAARTKKTDTVMTHPGDALGYYIFKRFPVFKSKRGVSVFQFPGGKSIVAAGGTVTETDREARQTKLLEEKQKRREERRKARDERQHKKDSSLGNYLRDQGMWPGGGGPGQFGSLF